MTYIICEPCVGVKDKACVEVCPVDCIHGKDEDDMLYINPEECIDCGACEPECPVDAIFAEEDVPDQWKDYIGKNYTYFGQEAPKGKEKNFIKTDPDKGFFVVFRFYGPLEGYIEKTWVLNDFDLIE